MDAENRRRMPQNGRRTVRRTKRPVKKSETSGDERRLIQLLISLALFLLVYIGRGVFPGQVEVWRNALTSNVDFQAAFQQFGQAVSEGETVRTAFEALCVTVFGGEPPAQREPDMDAVVPAPVEPVPLSRTGQVGLEYLSDHGALAGRGKPQQEPPGPTDEPAETDEPSVDTPSPEPTAAIVTAMAQDYDDAGRALPSNVSFAYYELGLEKTVVPVNGTPTSGFGYRDSPINGKNEFHLALDIGAAEGTEIGAFADGVVRYIGESDEFGQYLMIDHANNVSTFYAHCSKLLVHKGDVVTCGQTVALVGHTGNATGSHLHLTILKDNIRLDPAYYVEFP